MEKVNPLILSWQQALPGFGISYSGPQDGQLNPGFITGILEFENRYKLYSQVWNGSNIVMSVAEAKKKLGHPTEPSEEPSETLPTESTEKSVQNQVWKNFLSHDLPLVGKLYNGDLGVAAQNLEVAIGKYLGKSIQGMIWNPDKKIFNTTPEDIQEALLLLSKRQTSTTVSSTIDERLFRMAELLGRNV